jgi:hypothetical protein
MANRSMEGLVSSNLGKCKKRVVVHWDSSESANRAPDYEGIHPVNALTYTLHSVRNRQNEMGPLFQWPKGKTYSFLNLNMGTSRDSPSFSNTKCSCCIRVKSSPLENKRLLQEP